MAAQTVSTVQAVAFSEQMFELGKDLLDRVQVGWVFRQEEQFGAGGTNELAHELAFVAAEIVHDHNIAKAKCRQKNLLDISPKAHAVDWPLDRTWRIDPIMAQGGHGRS